MDKQLKLRDTFVGFGMASAAISAASAITMAFYALLTGEFEGTRLYPFELANLLPTG